MKKKGAANLGARALDGVRARRNSGAAASGNVNARGLRTKRGGQTEVAVGDGLDYGGKGEIVLREPAAPLSLSPGSPRRYQLDLDEGFEVSPKGRLRPVTSTSVKVVDGALVATPSLAEVTDPGNPGEDGVAALARKANTGDARFPIARGIATLVAGSATVALATVETGAIILLNHEQFAGSPGLLSYSVVAATSFTIASNDPADTSTVAYAVWNP